MRSFYLFRTFGSPSQAVFVFSCPESTPIRKKMTMSSSKASVLAATSEMDITFDKYCPVYFIIKAFIMLQCVLL